MILGRHESIWDELVNLYAYGALMTYPLVCILALAALMFPKVNGALGKRFIVVAVVTGILSVLVFPFSLDEELLFGRCPLVIEVPYLALLLIFPVVVTFMGGWLCQPKWYSRWLPVGVAVIWAGSCVMSYNICVPPYLRNDPLSDASGPVLWAKCNELFYVEQLQQWAVKQLETGKPNEKIIIPVQLYRRPPTSKKQMIRAEFVQTPGSYDGDPSVRKTPVQRWVFIKLFEGKVQDFHGHVYESKNGLIFGPVNAISPYTDDSRMVPVSPGIFSWPILYTCA